ncbi:MAG: ATP-dependent Clp protease proteolytic subunit [Flavisolibacter sp.]|jgi:ATP-dependent Clp endopeptidase proteolytic subunit ClpP
MELYFFYCVNPDSEEPIMLIDKHIGYDEEEGYGIMGDLFQRDLLLLDTLEKKRIQVWINSPGGDVDDGYNIYNAILKTKTKVDTYCYGMAASMAGVIFQAGRKRIMADYSWLMYHNPYGSTSSDLMATFTESIAKMIANRSGKTEDEIRAIMKKTTYIMADEALEAGLCDEVESSTDQNRKRAMPADAKAFWKESSKVLNKLLPETKSLSKNTDMKKVANKLNLNAEASEDSIVSEIESVQNKVKDQETEIAGHLTTIKNKTTEIESLKGDVKAKEDELTQLKNKVKQMEDDQKKKDDEAKTKAEAEEATKAKNMIEGYVKEGRIKNEEAVIKEWIEDCKVLGIDKVKNRIENLPINKKGVKIETSVSNDSKNLTGVVRNKMATKMAELEAKK